MSYKDYKKNIILRNQRLIANLDSGGTTDWVNFENYKLSIAPEVFNPNWGEGCRMMSKIKDLFIGDVLEIGTGSGILSIFAAEKAAKVIATDISPHAIECAKKNILRYKYENKISLREGSLFSVINDDEKFDTIIFNPPFLKGKIDEKKVNIKNAYLDNNYIVLESFLKEVKNYLKENGNIYICFGGVGDVGYLNYLIALNNYNVQIVSFSNSDISDLCFFVYKLSNPKC